MRARSGGSRVLESPQDGSRRTAPAPSDLDQRWFVPIWRRSFFVWLAAQRLNKARMMRSVSQMSMRRLPTRERSGGLRMQGYPLAGKRTTGRVRSGQIPRSLELIWQRFYTGSWQQAPISLPRNTSISSMTMDCCLLDGRNMADQPTIRLPPPAFSMQVVFSKSME